jgi:hypothetical protein
MMQLTSGGGVQVGPIRQLQRKLEYLQLLHQFEPRVAELGSAIASVSNACTQMVASRRLKVYLQTVLGVGNALHTIGAGGGTGRRRKAHGFRLQDLLKLKATKAMDRQTTLLDYVSAVLEKEDPAAVRFAEELEEAMLVAGR